MRLKKLVVTSLRNIRKTILEPGDNFNLLYGLNGQGKTNLLEAIFLLGNPRSFRNARLSEMINHQEYAALILGEVEAGGISNIIKLILEPAGRRVEINGKCVKKASELHGKFNSVIFSPDDTAMVRQGPDTRRRYLDRAVYMVDIGYLHCWHTYQRILKQRNQLLKSYDKSGLDVWTEQLALSGAEVIERRIKFVTVLDNMLQRHYAMIAGKDEIVRISYKPEGIPANVETKAALMELFERHLKSDEKYGTTTAGPHRDDLVFSLDGRLLKSFGSQGQQKSYILALKMAEMENIHAIFNESPILLLDDMSSELDAGRSRNLIDFLATRNIQVFITTTERSSSLLNKASQNYAIFHMEDGNLTFEGN